MAVIHNPCEKRPFPHSRAVDQGDPPAGQPDGRSRSTRPGDSTARSSGSGEHSSAWASVAELIRQLAFVLAAILLYFWVRGHTEGDVDDAIRHGLAVLSFEHRFGIDYEHWAQGLIIGRPRLVTLANWVYIWGHWPLIALTLFWLHHRHRMEYLVLRNALFISGAIGLVIFATYAVAPPRLVGVGLADTVTLRSDAYRLLQPPALVNKYAAVPSFHVGWDLLVGIAVFRASDRRLVKVLGVLAPVMMGVAVIVTANHYVIDGFIGGALSLIALGLSAVVVTPRMLAFDAWWHERLHHRRVVDDQAIDAPAQQAAADIDLRDRPGEDGPEAASELSHQGRGEQPGVEHHTVESDPRR